MLAFRCRWYTNYSVYINDNDAYSHHDRLLLLLANGSLGWPLDRPPRVESFRKLLVSPCSGQPVCGHKAEMIACVVSSFCPVFSSTATLHFVSQNWPSLITDPWNSGVSRSLKSCKVVQSIRELMSWGDEYDAAASEFSQHSLFYLSRQRWLFLWCA